MIINGKNADEWFKTIHTNEMKDFGGFVLSQNSRMRES